MKARTAVILAGVAMGLSAAAAGYFSLSRFITGVNYYTSHEFAPHAMLRR